MQTANRTEQVQRTVAGCSSAVLIAGPSTSAACLAAALAADAACSSGLLASASLLAPLSLLLLPAPRLTQLLCMQWLTGALQLSAICCVTWRKLTRSVILKPKRPKGGLESQYALGLLPGSIHVWKIKVNTRVLEVAYRPKCLRVFGEDKDAALKAATYLTRLRPLCRVLANLLSIQTQLPGVSFHYQFIDVTRTYHKSTKAKERIVFWKMKLNFVN